MKQDTSMPEKWKDSFCPPYFLDQLKFHPDPNTIIYVQSFDGRQPIFEFGFQKEEDPDYWFPMEIKDFLSLSCKMGWCIGEGWGFMD